MEGTNASSTIINTINTIFENLFTSIDISLYEVLDNLTFINSDILKEKYFEKIFGSSASNGILLICNSLIIGYIVYFAIKHFTQNISENKIENPWKFIIKIIIYGICMNSSYFIIEQILNLNSNISLAIRSIGEDIFKQEICFTNLLKNINNNLNFSTGELNIFSVDGLIKGTISMSLINLLTVYALRYVMVKILVLLAPFAILSLSLERTSWIFRTWCRSLFSLLIIQILVSVMLLVLFTFDYTNQELLSKFVYLGGIYALLRANSFAKEFMMGAGR